VIRELRKTMKILVINCGSSTLKFQLVETAGTGLDRLTKLAHGIVDRIGDETTVEFSLGDGTTIERAAAIADHSEATRMVVEWLNSTGLLRPDGLGAVGHRVVHGGGRFSQAALIDDGVLDTLETASSLAPLHNGPALASIRSLRGLLGSDVPQVAVFDTGFHAGMPDRAGLYAIPRELAEKHGIRRFGFHGLAHEYMAERCAAISSIPHESLKLITLQRGNGCSAAAVDGGRSVDTSMGLTPLEGLVMGTRCGDVDPSLAGFLARAEGVGVEDVEDWLNTRSGLLGVSGMSGDMRELLEAERRGDAGAALAVEMFCYRVRKYIGAYLAVLGGADAIVFGGGIGENAPEVRARVCDGMSWCGITLDRDRNRAAVGSEALISTDGAGIRVLVVPVDEAVIIARDTARCIDAHGPSG
jgi:acetate kinase